MKARIAVISGIMIGLAGLMVWTGEVGIAAIFFAILIVFGGAVLINLLAAKKIEVSLTVDEGKADAGQIPVRIHVENHSRFPVFRGKVEVIAENINFGFKNKEVFFFFVPGKGERDLTFSVSSDYCGKYGISLRNLQLLDVWGISRIPIKGEIKTDAFLYPSGEYLGQMREMLKANYEKERKFSGKKGQILSDILQYREYQKGDSLKHVNWKLSAKMDDLIVREFDTPVDNQILILSDIKKGDSVVQNLAYSVLFSICITYIKENIDYRIGIVSKEQISFQQVEDMNGLFGSIRDILSVDADGGVDVFDLASNLENLHKYSAILYITNDLASEAEKRMGAYTNIYVIKVEEQMADKAWLRNVLCELVA